MELKSVSDTKYALKVRVQELAIPPLRDVLILGNASPIGGEAIRKALALFGGSRFVEIEIQDEIISDIIVRSTILRLIPQEVLIDFVMRRIKPLMGPIDILQFNIDAEILLEEEI